MAKRDEFSDIVEAIFTGGLAGAEKGLKRRGDLRSSLQKSLLTSEITSKIEEDRTRRTLDELDKRGFKMKPRISSTGKVSYTADLTKDKKLTKTDIKSTRSQLMSQYLADLMGQAAETESKLHKILPGRQSKYERLRSTLVKREEPYVVKNKLQVKRLFKDLGITIDDWKKWIRENYGELEEKIFPTEKRLKLFERVK